MRQIRDFYVAPGVIVTGDVILHTDVNLWYKSVIRGDLAQITLKSRVNVQDGCIIHTDHGEPQTIEEGVVIGHQVVLHGRRVGRDTLIGMGSLLLSGSEIGEECLIAAGTLITEGKHIPPRSVIMGIPGKIVREVTDAEVERTRRAAASYLELAQRYAHGEFRQLWHEPPI